MADTGTHVAHHRKMLVEVHSKRISVHYQTNALPSFLTNQNLAAVMKLKVMIDTYRISHAPQ